MVLPLLKPAVKLLISDDTTSPMPPNFACPNMSFSEFWNIISPPLNIAPSETSTTEYLLGLLFLS